jgi:hypothetical protein
MEPIMELQEFVRNTVSEIVLGMKSAGDALRAEGIPCALNPIWKDENLTATNVLQIEFDVAVTVAESSKAEAGGGIKLGIQVVGFDAGGKTFSSSEKSSVSRVKFAIPYIPPSTTVDRTQGQPRPEQSAELDYDQLAHAR